MDKKTVNLNIINGLLAKGHQVSGISPRLLGDFADIMYKQLNLRNSSLKLEEKIKTNIEKLEKEYLKVSKDTEKQFRDIDDWSSELKV